MLGNVSKTGGVLPPAAAVAAPLKNHKAAEALARAQVVLIDGAKPAYTLPRSSGALDALARAETVISFASFLDDSGAWSDLLLPDHHTLESEVALVPAVSARTAVAVATPFLRPLYDTRPGEKPLADLARRLDVEYRAVTAKDIAQPPLDGQTTHREGAGRG